MHNFSSLLNITLHIADGLSVNHQGSKIVYTASVVCRICRTGSTNLYNLGPMMDGKNVRNM